MCGHDVPCSMLYREIFEQGKRAFVSFVHFYYKHECKLIFQAKGIALHDSTMNTFLLISCVIICIFAVLIRTCVHEHVT